MKRFSFVLLSFELIATTLASNFENFPSEVRTPLGDTSPLAENSGSVWLVELA